jgi:hypothetical protein
LAQVASTLPPSGVTIPKPVTTTRRICKNPSHEPCRLSKTCPDGS